MYCWGSGLNGNGSRSLEYAPTAIQQTGLTVSQLAVTDTHACALTSSGAAYCWGSNAGFDLGSETASGATPVAVGGGNTFNTIAPGGASTCGVTTSKSTYCWGTNTEQQLGLPPTADTAYATPVPVPGMTGP